MISSGRPDILTLFPGLAALKTCGPVVEVVDPAVPAVPLSFRAGHLTSGRRCRSTGVWFTAPVARCLVTSVEGPTTTCVTI